MKRQALCKPKKETSLKERLDDWRRAVARVSARIADQVVRIALVLFALALMLLGASASYAALFGNVPRWLPGAQVDANLLGSLGSLLLGFAGLYIGAKLRKYQEMEAQARANLALNVDLRTRLVCAGDNRILEMIIDVHNVSRSTWIVPMAYLFVRPALGGAKDIALDRESRNAAKYPATLTRLQPDEREQFFATALFTPEDISEFSAVVVKAETVGAPERWLGPERAMLKFVDFMEEAKGARHNYYCIARCEDRENKLYGKRCFVKDDAARTVDDGPTFIYRGLLDDMMLWSRERVISLSEQEAIVSTQRTEAVM